MANGIQIPNIENQVPMMFRAQTQGRCQLQRLIPNQQSDAIRWVDEWVARTYPQLPEFGSEVRTRVYQLSWRFVTNGGQDDSVIRPVIGARGWPFYPGSSMKGIFRRACTPDQADRYCGYARNGEFIPGILRFQGGYPTNTDWKNGLLDIVHPQQNRQVKNNNASAAFVQISLHKPELRFGISSTKSLTEEEWQEVWSIWEQAIATGIGCRVAAGYGQPVEQTGDILHAGRLRGQGQAAKLINGTGEFRPNVFRAGIRGHALRIFGGLTNEATAEQLVAELFGSCDRQNAAVGLLTMAFVTKKLEMGSFGAGNWRQPTYEVEGQLKWFLSRSLPEAEHKALAKLIRMVIRFAMLMGGFGKSWRRADHRFFYEEYCEDGRKPLIGCHWQWIGERSLLSDIPVRRLEDVSRFIDDVRRAAQEWMALKNLTPDPAHHAPWREAWHPDNVEVWGRVAEDRDDSLAIKWLHGPYQRADRNARIPEGSIYRTSVTGQMGQIGRLWHRMYPRVIKVKSKEDPNKPVPKPTKDFFELLTIFPDNSPESQAFLNCLQNRQHREGQFQRLWPHQ